METDPEFSEELRENLHGTNDGGLAHSASMWGSCFNNSPGKWLAALQDSLHALKHEGPSPADPIRSPKTEEPKSPDAKMIAGAETWAMPTSTLEMVSEDSATEA